MESFTTTHWLMLVVALITAVSGVFGWLLNRIITQQTILAKARKEASDELKIERDKHEESTFVHIAEKFEGLIAQITSLFSGQREIHEEFGKVYTLVNKNHAEVKAECANVISGQREQVTRCAEREKLLLDVQGIQREHISKFGKDITNLKMHSPMRLNDKEPLACTNGKKGEVE